MENETVFGERQNKDWKMAKHLVSTKHFFIFLHTIFLTLTRNFMSKATL